MESKIPESTTVWRLYESVKDSLSRVTTGNNNKGEGLGYQHIPIGNADIDIEAGLDDHFAPEMVENDSLVSGSPASTHGASSRFRTIPSKIPIQVTSMFSSKTKTE
jgi:hypothetical protein